MMIEFKHIKMPIIINIVLILPVVIVASVYLVLTTHSYFIKFGMSGLICSIGAYTIWFLIKDYLSTLSINNQNLIVTSQGIKYEVTFNSVVSIDYNGIAHSIIADCLILNCESHGKILIDCSYENYFDLWSQIIAYSEQANSRVVIRDSVRKRMKKGK